METEIKNDLSTLGGRIKAMREKSGLTQAGLAIKLGLSPTEQSQIHHYEHNKRPPLPERLKAIAQILNVSTNWLKTGVNLSVFNEEPSVMIVDLQKAHIANQHPKFTKVTFTQHTLLKSSSNSFLVRHEGFEKAFPTRSHEKIYPGDYLVVDPDEKPKDGDLVICQIDGEFPKNIIRNYCEVPITSEEKIANQYNKIIGIIVGVHKCLR